MGVMVAWKFALSRLLILAGVLPSLSCINRSIARSIIHRSISQLCEDLQVRGEVIKRNSGR